MIEKYTFNLESSDKDTCNVVFKGSALYTIDYHSKYKSVILNHQKDIENMYIAKKTLEEARPTKTNILKFVRDISNKNMTLLQETAKDYIICQGKLQTRHNVPKIPITLQRAFMYTLESYLKCICFEFPLLNIPTEVSDVNANSFKLVYCATSKKPKFIAMYDKNYKGKDCIQNLQFKDEKCIDILSNIKSLHHYCFTLQGNVYDLFSIRNTVTVAVFKNKHLTTVSNKFLPYTVGKSNIA